MRMNILIIAFAVAVISFGCEKEAFEPDVAEVKEAELSMKSAAIGITVEPYADRSSYIAGLPYLNPTQIDLNRQATGGSAYTKVFGFNIPEENQARGILWSNTSSTDDERTNLWRPQGITGFTKNGVRYLLIAWYARNSEAYNGSRVSLLDISPSSSNYLKYRHIILVQNIIPEQSSDYTQYGTFAPLNSHCGGMAYFNDKIYIASTSLGVRVFDINKIIEVNTESGSGTKCGEDSNGNLYAFGYRYILPQVGFYDINGGANPFSGLQLNEEGNEIWTCQYFDGSSDASIVPKIYGFPINSSGTMLNTGIEVQTPKNSLFTSSHAHGMQGIFRKGTRTWLSCTGSPSLSYGSTARLARYTDGDTNTTRFRWPYGSEGLYYEPAYDYLWSLTEFEPDLNTLGQINRCIFAVHFANYE
jgi:hypothetical protein